MPHVWSDDVVTGDTYDGTWTLRTHLDLTPTLRYHFVDDSAPIPWIFPGADRLALNDGVTTQLAVFGEIALAKDDPNTLLSIKVAFDSALLAQLITVIVTYNSITDEFRLDFSGPVGFLWQDAQTTSQGVWGTRGDVDTPNQLIHFLSARFVEPRPDVMEVEFDEANDTNSTRSSLATFFIPLQDHQVQFPFLVNEQLSEINIRWRRVNVTETACPMSNQWHLWFD